MPCKTLGEKTGAGKSNLENQFYEAAYGSRSIPTFGYKTLKINALVVVCPQKMTSSDRKTSSLARTCRGHPPRKDPTILKTPHSGEQIADMQALSHPTKPPLTRTSEAYQLGISQHRLTRVAPSQRRSGGGVWHPPHLPPTRIP